MGYIYVLTNPAFPEFLKIGKTTRPPAERAQELSSTGVPGPFEVAYQVETLDCDRAELAIHRRLSAYRHSDDRENVIEGFNNELAG